MGRSLESRLRRLESRAGRTRGLANLEEDRLRREWAVVWSRLSLADLEALEAVFEAIARGEDVCEVVDRLGAQAVVDRVDRAWEDLRVNGEPPSVDPPR